MIACKGTQETQMWFMFSNALAVFQRALNESVIKEVPEEDSGVQRETRDARRL